VLIKIYTSVTRYAAACFYGIRKYKNAAMLVPAAILSYLFLHFTFHDPFSYYPTLQPLFLASGRSFSQYV
jgi:hypothetical protein